MSTRSKVLAGILAFQSIALYCLFWFGSYAIACGHDWVKDAKQETVGALAISMTVFAIGCIVSLIADYEDKKGK